MPYLEQKREDCFQKKVFHVHRGTIAEDKVSKKDKMRKGNIKRSSRSGEEKRIVVE